jgi:hypothetical protein
VAGDGKPREVKARTAPEAGDDRRGCHSGRAAEAGWQPLNGGLAPTGNFPSSFHNVHMYTFSKAAHAQLLTDNVRTWVQFALFGASVAEALAQRL